MLASLYLVCTLLSSIWALGDFNAVRFISGGGPALSTHVLATLGIRNAFEIAIRRWAWPPCSPPCRCSFRRSSC